MWLTLKRDPGKKHWQAIAYYDDERSSLAVKTTMRNIMREWGDTVELKAVFLHETGCITPEDIRAHDPYWGTEEEEKRSDPVHEGGEEVGSRIPAKEVARSLALSTDMTMAQSLNVIRLVGKSLTLAELRKLQRLAGIVCHGRYSDTEGIMTKLLSCGLVAIRCSPS